MQRPQIKRRARPMAGPRRSQVPSRTPDSARDATARNQAGETGLRRSARQERTNRQEQHLLDGRAARRRAALRRHYPGSAPEVAMHQLLTSGSSARPSRVMATIASQSGRSRLLKRARASAVLANGPDAVRSSRKRDVIEADRRACGLLLLPARAASAQQAGAAARVPESAAVGWLDERQPYVGGFSLSSGWSTFSCFSSTISSVEFGPEPGEDRSCTAGL